MSAKGGKDSIFADLNKKVEVMKKIGRFFYAGIISFSLLAGAALAEQGRYVSVSFGKTGGLDYVTSAGALGTWYAGGAANAKLDSAGLSSIAIGSSLGASPFRAELSLNNHSHSGNLTSANFLAVIAGDPKPTSIPSKLRTTSVELIGFYDFPTFASIEPYIGLGGGLSKVKIVDHVSTFDNTKSIPHFAGVIGANYKLTDNTLGFMELRQEVISGAKIVKAPEKKEDLSSLGAKIGIRFYF